MSTNALVAYKNGPDNYDAISVRFDGYVEGVGRMLYFNWSEDAKIAKLCKIEKEIRELGEDFDKTEFYPVTNWTLRYIHKFKGISQNDLENQAGNFSYTYIYSNGTWWMLKNGELKNLDDNFLDERMKMEDESEEEE